MLWMLMLVGTAEPALAGGLEAKTMRLPLPAREVERALILPKGWVQFDLGYDHHIGTGAWNSDGTRRDFEHAEWMTMSEHIRLRWGVARKSELWWYLPFEQARLDNDQWRRNQRLFDHSLGDPEFGFRYSLLQTEAPLTSLILETWYKGPAGQEAPGSYIGGPLNVTSIPFTTGTPDLYLGAGIKREVGPLGFTLKAGYLRRFSAVVQYLVEIEELQFLGRIKPGDQIRADIEVLVQLGPIALAAQPRWTYRFDTKVGTTSNGVSPSKNLTAVADSSGDALDLRGELQLNATRGFDIAGYFQMPLMGEDLQFFPIEDLQPTLGPTFGGRVEFRY